MDGQHSGSAVNGGKGSGDSRQNDNESKEKVNKTLLLRQQIEENRIRMQQREKEISNSKRNLEQLFTQLDRSCSGVSLNLSTDVEDVRDTKIASLESSLSALKSEKRELELRLLSLETIQEAKECLELEMSELRASHDHVAVENSMLQARMQNFHALEDENDELKLAMDRLAYENSSLKEDLETRDNTISSYEAKLSKLNQDLEEIKAINAASKYTSLSIEALQQQMDQISNERDQLKSDCEALQAKLSEASTATPVTVPSPEVKVSSLGAKKKPRVKRGKGDSQSTSDEVKIEETPLAALESQITLLTSQRDTLESENVALKSSISNMEVKLTEADSERHTLQQRVELLMAELRADTNVYNNNDLANLQKLLEEKEAESAKLTAEIDSIQAEKGEMVQRLEKADEELFKLRAKCRDSDYTLNSKEETIRELQLRLTAQPSETPAAVEVIDPPTPVKVSSLGATKKSRSRGKGGRPAHESKAPAAEEATSTSNTESLVAPLNTKIAALEQEIIALNEQAARVGVLEDKITSLQEQLASNEQEKRTLQKRVDLLLSELESSDIKDDIANLQELLQSKGDECVELSAKVAEIQAEKNEICQRLSEADGELFKLRAQQRDTQYLLGSKDENISDLHEKLEMARVEADQLKELMAELESKLSEKESSQLDEEKSMCNTVANLQEALRQARHEISSVESELADRSEAVQKLEKSCSALNKDVADRNTEIHRLKEDLQDAEVVLAEKDAKLKAVQDELKRMKISADDNNSLTMLETELNHSQMETEIMRNDLETRCSQLNECKEFSLKLEAQLEEARAREAELLSQSENANAQKVAAEEKLGQVSEKFKKLAANYKQKLQVIQQLEAKHEKLKHAAESEGGEPQLLQVRLVETESEVAVLREQLNKIKETAEQLAQTRQTLSQTEQELGAARDNAQQAEEESRKLIAQLEEYKIQLDQARQDLSQSEENLHSTQAGAQQSAEENTRLQERITELEGATEKMDRIQLELERVESDLAASRNQLQSSQEVALRMTEENNNLMEQLQQTSERVYQLEQLQNEADFKAREADNHIHKLMQEHSAVVEQLRATREELQSISSSYGDQGSIQSSLEDRIRSVESEASGLRSQLTEVSNFKDNLYHEAEAMRHRIEELQAEVNSGAESAATMQHQLADLWEEKESLANRNAHIESELNQLKCQQNDQSSSQAASLEREIQELRDQLAAAQWDLDTKTNELSSMQQMRDQLSTVQWELDAKVEELSVIQQQRTADTERIAQLEKQCADTNSWIEANFEDVSALKTRIQELENQLADLNNQYGGLYSTYGSKLFEMTALENQLADANHKISELTEELTRNQSSMEDLTAKSSLMEQDVQSSAALREQLADLERANAGLLDQLRERTEEIDSIKRHLQGLVEERDELGRSLDSLRMASEDKSELLNQKESQVADLQRQLDEYRAVLECTDTERNRAVDELRLKDNEVGELRQQLAGLEEQAQEFKRTASDVQEIGMLRMNLADLSAERDDLSYQVEDVQAQCSALETKIGEAEEVRSILETTVSYLESKVSELQSQLAITTTGREEDLAAHSAQLAALMEERDGLAARLSSSDVQNQELVSLRLTLEEAERMLKESDSALKDARARVEELERQLADSLRCLQEEQRKHRQVLDDREELVDQVTQASHIRSERDNLLERVSQLERELTQVEAITAKCHQYEAEAEEAAKLRDQIDEWKNQAHEVSQLRVKLFDAISEKDDLESSVQALEEELATVQNQLGAVQAELVAQRQSSTELAAVQDELASVRNELEANKTSSGDLLSVQDELATMRIELEASRQSSAELATVRSELEANRKSSSVELDALRSELEAGRVSTFELNARCADLDMERNLLLEKCMELKDVHTALETKCADLERLRAEVVVENEHFRSEYSKMASSSSQMSEASLSELAQLRVAIMDLTSEREELEEKLADAEDRLTELTSLRITNSELSMELEEAQARIQVIEEERLSEMTEMKRQLSETVIKISQQEERIDRVSVERDQLQQAVSRMGESPVRTEKAEMETQEKTEGDVPSLLKQIAGLESELHEAKVKAAKSLRQVKLLRAELAKEKEAAAAAASSKQSGGDDYFNFAVEEELRKQLTDSEKVTAEKVKEIERLLMRIDTLEGANERFMQAKERQDNEMAMVQQRNRELLSQMASMEWDNPETAPKEKAPEVTETKAVEASSEEIAALESTISQLTDDNENYQDMLDELKAERQAVEAELKERIAALEADIVEKSRLLDEVSLQVENKDRLLSDAYDSVSQLRKQVMQLSEGAEPNGLLEDLRRENENLVDMIRQLSTTGTLDAATVQRLKDEIDQAAGDDGDRFQQSSDQHSDGAIDWQSGFNDLQIEVEYLRSQNASLLNRLQEAGLVWDEGTELVNEDSDRLEMLRLQLDNAIRNVHERDMRCQELTWEITKLLEERDTLQLRLSNSLRQNHEMQQELKDFSATASGASPIGDITAKLRELKQLNYSLDVQLRREQEERQTIERQLMALYGTRGGSTSPIYANGARRATSAGRQLTHDADGSEFDLNSSQEFSGTGQVLSEWLKGKGSSEVQHI